MSKRKINKRKPRPRKFFDVRMDPWAENPEEGITITPIEPDDWPAYELWVESHRWLPSNWFFEATPHEMALAGRRSAISRFPNCRLIWMAERVLATTLKLRKATTAVSAPAATRPPPSASS